MVIYENETRENEKYIYKLADFEGPLDLLLHLVKEAKIEIKNIFMSDVTEQFLEYMKELDTIDMDKAAEFVDVASTLLEIKVKAMLPKMDDLIMLSEEEDPKDKLIRQLEEYNLFKQSAEKLKQAENLDRFYKLPDEKVSDYRVVLKNMTLNGLLDAFSGMLHKVAVEKERTVPKKIVKDRFTVAEKIEHIKYIIQIKKKISFFNLFESDYTKSEMINTFLALLELLKVHFIKCIQTEMFGDIILEYNELYDEKEVLNGAE